MLPRLIDGLADREQSDDENDDVDAVEQLRNPERKSRVACELIDSHQTQRESEKEAEEAANDRIAEQHRNRCKGDDRQREVLGRPELQRERRERRGEEGQRDCGQRAGDKRSNRCRGQRRRAATLPRHHVAIERGRDGTRFPWRVQQNARRRSTVHGSE